MGLLSPTDESLLGSVAVPTQGSLTLPGPSYSSALAAQEVLQDNHVKFDWQFSSEGLHNHLAHAVLASYSLGASPEFIKDIYRLHALAQRPMLPIINRMISYQNWTRFLGKDEWGTRKSYYSSFLVFFTQEIERYGAAATIERYLFKFRDGKLLHRTISGALHPLIQLGHGVEFGLDALVAEGLAQACVHSPRTEGLFPPSWPAGSGATAAQASALSGAFSRLNTLKSHLPSALKRTENRYAPSSDSFTGTAFRLDPGRDRHPRLGLSGFTVIAHMLADPRLAAGQANKKDDFPRFDKAVENRGDVIREWCEEWIVDEAGGWKEIVEKTEELFWIATVLVGAVSRVGYKPRMDFFLMHTLTSAIFLPSLLEVLSPSSRIALLHSHFRVTLAYWVSRGRPYLNVVETLMAASEQPSAPGSVPYQQSDVIRTYKQGGTKEAEIRQKEEEEDRKKRRTNGHASPIPPSSATFEQGPTPQLSTTRTGRDRSDSEVDVPLDSPADEERAFQMSTTEAPEDDLGDVTHTSIGDESRLDGARTPTMANGHGVLQSEFLRRSQSSKAQPSSSSVWASIIASAVDHSDEHVTKMIRSLAFAAQHFGMSPPGVFRSSLPGTEIMDGSIFVRLAGILMHSLGWVHEGQRIGQWDRSVLGFDEAWQEETRDLSAAVHTRSQSGDFTTQRDFHNSFIKVDKGKQKAANLDS